MAAVVAESEAEESEVEDAAKYKCSKLRDDIPQTRRKIEIPKPKDFSAFEPELLFSSATFVGAGEVRTG